jgi:small subunit ribosomal protein S8
MAVTDPIADYLTRLRNAQSARHRVVDIPLSGMKLGITEILYKEGFIHRYKVEKDAGPQGLIRIALKYNDKNLPVIKKLGRISTPGLRRYAKSTEIPRIINNLGICIVSTNKGVMTGTQAKEEKIGGELICYVY